jgi:hypothetical protein
LIWELNYSEKEFSIQAQAAKGRPFPDWVVNEPPLFPGDDFYLSAFYHLSTCRIPGEYLPGPIPWDKTYYYGVISGLDEDNLELFIYVIREMDSEYLGWYGKKLKEKSKPPKRGKYGRL